MKKLLLFSVAVFGFGICVYAQDIITLKNGEELQTLVQEVGDVDVKYKKFDNPNGPNYSLKKSEIFMIRYANGSRDVFATEPVMPVETLPVPIAEQPNTQRQAETQLEPLSIQGIKIYNSNGVNLSRNGVRNVMRNVPEALELYNEGQSLRATGYVFMGLALGCCGVSLACSFTALATDEKDLVNYSWYALGGALVFMIPEFIIFSAGNKKIINSVGAYNRGIRQGYTSDVSLNFGITRSGGVGFTINF